MPEFELESFCSTVARDRITATFLVPTIIYMLLDRADVRTRHDMTSLQKSTRGAVWSPKSVEFRNDLPVTALGKLDRKVARAPYWAGHSRDVG